MSVNFNFLKKTLIPFLFLLRSYWVSYFFSIFLIILSAIFSAIAPLYFAKLIDAVSNDNSLNENSNIYQYLIELVVLYISFQIMSSAFKSTSEYISSKKSEEISHYLRSKLSDNIFHLKKDHSSFLKKDTGMILSFFSRDIESLWDFFGFALNELISSFILIVALCIIVFSIDPFIGIVLIIMACSFVFLFYFNGNKVREYFANAAPKFDFMIGFINYSLSFYETIASFRSQEWIKKYIEKSSLSVTFLANKAHSRSIKFSFFTSFINLLCLMVIWLLCIPSLIGKNSSYVDVSLGDFVAILTYFSMIMAPLESISSSAKAISKGSVSMKRLSSLLLNPSYFDSSDIIHDKKVILSGSKKYYLEINSVGYNVLSSEGKVSKILSDISFTISKGDFIGIAGESGSGKSTLLRLIARFYSPTDGAIYFKGDDIEGISENEFRNIINFIPQKSSIFPVSLRENLILDDSLEVNDEAIYTALKKASIEKFSSKLLIDEDISSTGLSGGESQRISLSRAFFKESSFMVIDEPTSALDLNNSIKVSKSLFDISRKGAVIVASHDSNILERCDRVIVIQDGKIVTSGKHTDLHNSSELYRSIISHVG